MTPARLDYVLRVRDLVHGYVHLTQPEVEIINQPLFQRLRHVRQNDVAFFVYPSLNISRFEHSLGCAHVAGKMAENLFRSTDWQAYETLIQSAIGLQPNDFVQTCRVYALLHDIGHLPLSHLFELAFDNYVFAKEGQQASLSQHCARWFGVEGFAKLHEACGAAISSVILDRIELQASVRSAVLSLMRNKSIPATDPLSVVKLLVDSEVDADRIDATARDGFLAGQEYGNYDIERLCSSVFLQKRGASWRIAYSHKAIGSIEGLLLDRCRTHTWIHFHHRVVSTKVAAAFLITEMLARKQISEADFKVADPKGLALRDDIWLWSLLRSSAGSGTSGQATAAHSACMDALLYRDNHRVTPLWKNRTEYHEATQPLILKLKQAGLEDALNPQWFDRKYERWISEQLGIALVPHWLKFKPISNALTPLTDEYGKEDHGHVRDSSPLTRALDTVWSGEPSFYIVCLGDLGETAKQRTANVASLREKWVGASVEWIRKRQMKEKEEEVA